MRLLDRLRAVLTPTVTRDDALRVARDECAARGWPWTEPVHVSRELTSYYVMTNARSLGGNVNIRVSVVSGEVVSAAFARR